MMTLRFDASIRLVRPGATKSRIGRSSAARNHALTARAALHSRLRKIFQPALPDAGHPPSKWLHDHQNDDQNHEDRGRLVHDPVETNGPLIRVFGEGAHEAGEKPVQTGEAKNQDELHLEPACLPISREIGERDPGYED